MISCQISNYISKDIFLNLQIYPKISQDILPFSPSLSGRPATAAGIGPTMCARLGDPSGSLHAHVSDVPSSRSHRCRGGCSIIAVRQVCRSSWDAAMGSRLGCPLHDPYGCLDAESLPQGLLGLVFLREDLD